MSSNDIYQALLLCKSKAKIKQLRKGYRRNLRKELLELARKEPRFVNDNVNFENRPMAEPGYFFNERNKLNEI